ncbi:hypothetical protein BCR35DRAFT_100568 [Leucosporidium creatinivorum]|uniref:Transcription factor domain-containing protein n=1 Tax=Leucosporidium creatinivorum TaxID=106004 RepID=A0A1Y2F4S7_9BASI|nr:hypothetical protein BCR35DRAFT_100568 [Leucosporidium creatinivorum]
MYRSSAFHWSSKLAIIACRISSAVYAKRGIGLAARRNCVPALHLELQTWYHALPGHVKVSAADATKSPHPHVIAVNLLYWLTLLQLHRPFFSRVNHPHAAQPNSTEKCLLAASHIVRLIKVQQRGQGYRFVHPTFIHAAFAAGTILVLSSSQTGISPSLAQDSQRQQQAGKDLKVVIQALKEAGATWSAAVGSAETLMGVFLIVFDGRRVAAATRPMRVEGMLEIPPSSSRATSAELTSFRSSFRLSPSPARSLPSSPHSLVSSLPTALLATPTTTPSTPPLTVTSVEPLPSSLAPLLDPTAPPPNHILPLDLPSLDPQLQQHAIAQQQGGLQPIAAVTEGQLGTGGSTSGGLMTGQQTPTISFPYFSERLFPSWDYGQDPASTEFEFAMNTL